MRKFNVNVNGNSYSVEIEEIGAEENAVISAPVEAVKTPVAAPKAVAPKAAAGSTIVKAPMPGLILKLEVADGTTVKKGQKIIGLEAMKMENDIVASADGVITFLVKKGDNVVSGAELAAIK